MASRQQLFPGWALLWSWNQFQNPESRSTLSFSWSLIRVLVVVLPPAASWSFPLTSKGGFPRTAECKCKQASASRATQPDYTILPLKSGHHHAQLLSTQIFTTFSIFSDRSQFFYDFQYFPKAGFGVWDYTIITENFTDSRIRNPPALSVTHSGSCISHLLWLLKLNIKFENPCVTVAQSSWRVSYSGRCPVAEMSLPPTLILNVVVRGGPPT